jgi:hypothetical protein
MEQSICIWLWLECVVCNWLHSVGQNHFYVMMLLNRDSVIFRVVLLEDSVKFPSQRNRIPCICLDDMVFHTDAQLSKHHLSGRWELSIQTFLCVENVQIVPGCIRPEVSATLRMPFSVRQGKGLRSKTQIWEESCNCLDYVGSRLDTSLDKASRAEEVQSSRRQSLWSGRSSLNMEIACSKSATVRMLGQHLPDVALFKKEYRANLESWLHNCPSGHSQLLSGYRLVNSNQMRFWISVAYK